MAAGTTSLTTRGRSGLSIRRGRRIRAGTMGILKKKKKTLKRMRESDGEGQQYA